MHPILLLNICKILYLWPPSRKGSKLLTFPNIFYRPVLFCNCLLIFERGIIAATIFGCLFDHRGLVHIGNTHTDTRQRISIQRIVTIPRFYLHFLIWLKKSCSHKTPYFDNRFCLLIFDSRHKRTQGR